MYNYSNCTERSLYIKIGGESIHISFANDNGQGMNLIANRWHNFVTHSGKNDWTIKIIRYPWAQTYFWRESVLHRIGKFFLHVQQRFPVNGDVYQAVERSVSVLQHLDPEDQQVGQIIGWFENPANLAYTIIGSNLYLLNHQNKSAVIFIRESPNPLHIIAGIEDGVVFVLSHYLIHHQGLLIHGASLQKNKRTALFLGVSGAGKSTITRICRPDICFSDDVTILKKENNRIYAYSSPFTQILREEKLQPSLKGEIKRIFLLEKSRQNKILPISKSDFMGLILTNLIHFFKYLNQETASTCFYLVKDIIETIPSYTLRFNKKSNIWDDIW